MSAAHSQTFRARLSCTTISIPTRLDLKNNKDIVLWTDIQQCFQHARYVMCGQEMVLFLTDSKFKNLIPLRIAYCPDKVLDVVTDDNQGDPGTKGDPGNSSCKLSAVASSSGDVASDSRDVAVAEIDDDQAFVVHSESHSPGKTDQQLSNSGTSHHPEAVNNATLQAQLYQLQQQAQQWEQHIDDVLGRTHQTDQQTQHAQEQMQGQIDMNLKNAQQLDQQMQRSLQQAQEYQQQVQQQMDKVLHKVQQIDHQAQHALQQHKRMLQQIREMEMTSRQQGLLLEQRHQEALQVIDQFVHAQYRVQAIVANPPKDLPTPRLFIILPDPTGVVDRQGRLYSLQFRLYFLCECGDHTTIGHCNEPHEVHLANHPGYELVNQNEFIDKYGSYLLTMMYMVKYGAKTGELTVPPLLYLSHTTNIDREQGHLQFIKMNISRLVDDTITHLKEAIGATNSNNTADQTLEAPVFTDLKSHLKAKDDEGFPGGLSRMRTQKARSAWICSYHLCESYGSALQQLKNTLDDSGGERYKRRSMIVATSEAMIKMFYETLDKIFKIQGVKNWRSLIDIDLRLDSRHQGSSSTMDILGSFKSYETLTLDFGRLKMHARGIPRGEIKDVSIEVKALSCLTLDDLEFIQQCRPITFAILEMPQRKEESRLVNILERNPSIHQLNIQCPIGQYIHFINLVKSTREKSLQSECRPALRIVELANSDNKAKMVFQEGRAFDVEVELERERCRLEDIDPDVNDFLLRYGPSVKAFVLPCAFSDRFAKLLDESIQEIGSSIARLDITPSMLTTPGLDAISRVIHRLQSLKYLRLSLEYLEQQSELEKALLLLERHRDRLTSLRLNGWYDEKWLPPIAQAFPNRDAFPALEEFVVESSDYYTDVKLTGYLRDWILSMISSQPPSRPPLRVVGVGVFLQMKDWEDVMQAIDLSAVEELSFRSCRFWDAQLKLLAAYVVNSDLVSLPLRLVDLSCANLDDNDETNALLLRIQGKVRHVQFLMGSKYY